MAKLIPKFQLEEQRRVKMEQNLVRNFKIEMTIIKYIPFILALFQFITIFLQLFFPYIVILGYIGGTSLITLLFFYLSSYIFKFCEYHRMPIYYLFITQLICLFDLYLGIPISLLTLLIIHILLFCLLIILIINFKYGTIKKFNCKWRSQIYI